MAHPNYLEYIDRNVLHANNRSGPRSPSRTLARSPSSLHASFCLLANDSLENVAFVDNKSNPNNYHILTLFTSDKLRIIVMSNRDVKIMSKWCTCSPYITANQKLDVLVTAYMDLLEDSGREITRKMGENPFE